MNNIIQTIRHTARAATVLLLALLAAQTAGAQTNVSNAAGLAEAFGNTNVSVVNVTNDITGVGDLPPLNRDLTINLNGHTISGDGLYFDVGPKGSLTINRGGGSVGNIIRGNANEPAIYNRGTVTLSNVNITTYPDCAILGFGTLNIGDNVSFKYISDIDNAAGLAAALKDQTVSVVNVTDNITGVGNLSLDRDRALTINLNGHTISGDGLYFDVGPDRSLTINGEGQDGSVGNIISGNAGQNAIDNSGTVTLRNVNITTNSNFAIGGPGMPYIGNNVSFNGWTDRPFYTTKIKIIEGANYNSTVVATVTVGGKTHYFENLSAALAYIANNPGNDGFSLSGDTYTIKTAADWGIFCDMLEGGETFSGKTVKLDADITVTRMAGGQPFTGTFDGQNHKLTLAYGTADAPVDAQFVAPFVETARETSPVFRNLTIDGTIYATHTAATDHDHVGGLIGHLFGDVTIEHCVSRVEIHAKGGAGGFVGLCEHSVSFTDCHSAAVIASADGSNSGFVAWSRDSGWEINFTGCLFDGKLLQQNGTGHSNGGFIGWKGDAKTVNITNCLCAPATLADGETMATDGSATFSREHSNYPATIKNSYYTQTLGAAQGKQARAVTAGTDVTVAHAGVPTHYATSGITAYKATGASTDSDPFIAGLLYNNNAVDVLYAGSDEVVSLTLSNTGAPQGYQYGYTTNAGTLEGSTLTMPDQDVTVSVNTDVLTVLPWSGDGSKSSPYLIEYPSQLDLLAHRVNGTNGETRQTNGYSGKYFKLANDISYSHTTDWNAFTSNESNFEAIGGYHNGGYRYFRGHFDGNNNTISGIRIYKGGNGYADYYQGIFGRTGSGADIHDLTLADARITGYNNTGGIMGENAGGTVTRCHVAGDVAVCAVQSNAYYHGGIAGDNDNGTIEQCTSAVTLTTADANNSKYYGGIAGFNDNGTLSDNLTIGATVPAAAANSYGAITGYNGGSLQRNYYHGCKVADTENATGVGCGYISDGNGGYTTADVTANNGAVSIHTLTLADGITTSTPVTVTIGTTGYYAPGTAIALSYSGTPGNIPDGYQYEDGDGFTASAGTINGSTLTMPAADVTVSLALTVLPWSGDGTESSPYIIYNKDQLDLLAHRVNGTHGETANDYKDTYFQLGKDITYTHTTDWDDAECEQESNFEPIGGRYDNNNRYFRGHFDGNNNTISGIRIYKDGDGDADNYQGIFGRTNGADIHDLTLADARITGYDDTGGIVGYNYGGTVSGCHVADDVAVCAVQSDAYYHGGIVGYNDGTIEQCTSAATLTTADASNSYCYGGIAGYNGGTLCDNLAIGATMPAAAYNSYGAITGHNNDGSLQRNYYAACNVNDTPNATGVGCGYISDGNGGRITADVTANNGAVSIHTLTLAEGITTTTAATVTIGTTGYYAQGTAIALSYSGTTGDGYQLGIVSNDGNGSNAATADGSGNYTAVMPAADATAKVTVTPWDGDGTEGSPYIIEYASQLDLLAYRVNGTHGETRQTDGYENKFFQLAKDIKYTPSDDWDDFDSDESNYEAIGGYYDDDDRSFRGHFDGNNKTISGIRIYKDGDGDADCFQGIFGLTVSGADIHDLTLADARITGYQYTGGIVGYNDGGTVSGCHVAADVAVCAVQSYAWYHGGIVGLNRGTIEQCTSAATLTIANADNSQYYGGIAGYNNKGTLSDNLAIGAIVPAAKNNSYGAITGYTGGAGGTLQRNYYTACKVNDTENATGVGCGNIDDGNGGYITADVTANNGAVCINTLALTANLAPDGNYWTTYYNSALGFTIDENENACAYTATYGGSQLTLHKLGKEIPKNTAVIIVADNDVVSMTAATALDDFSGTNDLLGVDDDTPISILDEFGTFYVLGMTTVGGDQHFGFHRYTGTDMAAHKAFIFVASSPSQAARSLTMVFDEASGIESAEADSSLFTLHSSLSSWFTLDGRRLQAKPTAPGIYVNNGKKVVIK